jgi:hypothetical protein
MNREEANEQLARIRAERPERAAKRQVWCWAFVVAVGVFGGLWALEQVVPASSLSPARGGSGGSGQYERDDRPVPGCWQCP